MAERFWNGRTAANIPEMTYRVCRTTFATYFDGDKRDMQTILGPHSAAISLDRYRKALPERPANAIEALDARLSRKVVPTRVEA
jgi:hypothetical protein